MGEKCLVGTYIDKFGIKTFAKLPFSKEIKDEDYVVFGTPFDTLSLARGGSRYAPSSIREAYGANISYKIELGVISSEYVKGIDIGDIPVFNGDIEKTFESVENNLKSILQKGAVPVNLGGDSSIILPELRAYRDAIGKVAIVHFTSRYGKEGDNSKSSKKYNQDTAIYDAINENCINTENSISIGMRGLNKFGTYDFYKESGMETITAFEAQEIGIDEVANRIRNKVGHAPVVMVFDIGFLDPAYAPGTDRPQQGGMTTWETLEIIRKGLLGLNLVGCDILSVNPLFDLGGITSMSASNVASEFIALVACEKAKIKSYDGFGGRRISESNSASEFIALTDFEKANIKTSDGLGKE